MNRTASIFFAILAVALLTLGTAQAQGKFKNKDTATNRQDSTWGTSDGQSPTGDSVFGTDPATGDSTMEADPGPKKEPVDWYDKVIITVNPNVDYPYNKDGVSTTTTTTYNNATDTQTTSTTTTTD
ncbi:hypothetical protein [Salidesulfovibrio onnuriiensis]|uniref:hypothetical protein n=1 Tax=Salidesulfovibrio onnuriiensis TaxID=2583823 RepID=UPI0011CA244F|nr:hypothetical protein [Salidesulfovibrio onnuriiensis]